MVASAFDASKHEALAEAVAQLTPEEAAYYVDALNRALKKRKLQLVGYLVGAIAGLVGMVVALIIYGNAGEGTFVAWAFAIPFGAIGLVLYLFGRMAEAAGGSGTIAQSPQRGALAAGKGKRP